MQSKAIVTVEEIIPIDEPEQIQRAKDNFIKIINDTNSGLATRGAHAKGHACVKAYFDVDANLDPQLKHGIFKTAGIRYKSWIRFSNGSSNLANSDDNKKDSRGMAIKLFKLEQTEQLIGAGTQDFLMHNSPAFFSTDLDDYNQLVESKNKIKYFLNSTNPFNWRLRELSHVMDTLSAPPYSPVWDEYFSNTAYKLGPHNIKFMTKSCTASPPEQTNPNSDQPDFLKTTLANELSNGSVCMNMMVQLQDPNKLMPIEDVSVLWKQSDSPFIPVATITILKQEFDSPEQEKYCENLSFSPWNTLIDHRPIGALNRVRKVVYEASSMYRHSRNQQAVAEVIDWNDL
ncbi:catalase family protein [Pseudomonadota bacterium]|nr:catalase family protein [Pseudomonadota bacterium]